MLTPSRVYVALSVTVALLMVGQTMNHLWSGVDFWVWLGPVREFSVRPMHPHHPLLALDAPDSYMGPYSFVLGLITRATGADAIMVMAIAGMFNLALILIGIWYLARSLSPLAWTPPLLLAFTMVAWGWEPWRWSGYPHLSSLGTVLPLGSSAAYGLGVLSLGAWWRWLSEFRMRHLCSVVVGLGVVILTHQPTALWVSIIAVGFVAARWRHLSWRAWLTMVAGAVAGAILLILWPFYSVIELITNLNGYDDINQAMFWGVAQRSALALPGVGFIMRNAMRRRQLEVGIPMASLGVVFGAAWLVSAGSIGRVFPGVMLLAHLAMADWAATQISEHSVGGRRQRSVWIGLLAVVALGVIGTASGWVRSIPRGLVSENAARQLRLTSYIDPNRAFADYLEPDDVVAAVAGAALPIGGFSARVLAVNVPEPFVPDAEQRWSDVNVMLDVATAPSVRDALIARYSPDWLVVRDAQATSLSTQVQGAVIRGSVNGFTLIELDEG